MEASVGDGGSTMQTVTVVKGASGFGMRLSALGAVHAYTEPGSAGELAGVPVGAEIREVNGVAVGTKKEIVAQLKLATEPAVRFTFTAPAAIPEGIPQLSVRAAALEPEPEPEQQPAQAQAPAQAPKLTQPSTQPASGGREYLCVLKANVRPGPSIHGPKLREIQPGATVVVFEEAMCDGHLRGRIESESLGQPQEWLSIRTKLGNQLLEPLDGSAGGSPATEVAHALEPGFPPTETIERVEFFQTKTTQETATQETATAGGVAPKSYTVYCVRCFPQEGAPWEVERRFSEFFTLWYELEAAGATAVNRLDFPSRSSSWMTSQSAVEVERSSTLAQFLNFMIALGGTESLDKKSGNRWPGEKAIMLFLAAGDEDAL